MIKFFVKYYKPHKMLFAFDLLCAFFASLIDLMYPIAMNKIIDDYVPNKNIRFLVAWVVVLFVIFVLRAFLTYWMQYWGHVVGVRMQGDMRSDMFKHLQKLPLSYFDETKVGSLMSRLVNDLMDISELAHHGPEDLFISMTLIIGSFFFMAKINLPITLIVFAFLPFAVIFAVSMHKRMMAAFIKTREETATVNAVIENSLSGIRVAKSFVTQQHEQEKFDQGNQKFIHARNKAYKVMGQFFSGSGLCIDMLNLIALAAGGYYTIIGRISVGEFASYIMFVTMFMNPIRKLVTLMEQFQNGMSGFKRFTEILDVEAEKDIEGAKNLEEISGDIVFDNVSFKYPDSQNILDNINLTIKSGATTAFVGESGAGKTTLCHLIPRFYDVIQGEIKINDENIKNYTLSSLRGKIGIVAQNVFLFTGTIKENIAYGSDNATMEDI
ncbi:MAG: ABC transporter ATP-binding protein, partial [Oscillospiraceae bacterium]